MRLLNGLELAGFIQERQVRQVRSLRQAHNITPKLAIVQTNNIPVINTYIKLKKAYGDDILAEVEAHVVTEDEAMVLISKLNKDPLVHGIIVQLPLADPTRTDELVNAVAPEKDVDALGKDAVLTPATPLAIAWLLAGYNVELRGKKIAIVGQGRLVGAPLTKMFAESGLDVTPVTRKTPNLPEIIHASDIIITATGVPGLITSEMVQPGAVVVDAGVATDAGKLVGDLAPEVHGRADLTITPKKGGVGPLTVCALFENTIQAARSAKVDD